MSAMWVEKIMKQIGYGIEAGRAGKSDQWIATRTEELGHPISRPAISEYRRGVRKTMPVTDWLVISAALGVPPVSLLFPGVPDRPSTFIPALIDAPAFDCVMWASGERQTLPDSSDLGFDLETGEIAAEKTGVRQYRGDLKYNGINLDRYREDEPSPQFQVLQKSRELRDEFQAEHSDSSQVMELFQGKSLPKDVRDGIVKSYTQSLNERNARIKELETQIRELGGVVIEETQTTHGDNDGDR